MGKKKPKKPTYFVDRSLGKGVAKVLREAGANVEFHDDHFNQDADDTEWIPEVSSKGWVILTKDKAIRRRADERSAILLNDARVFALTSGNMTGKTMADLFVGQLTNMDNLALTQSAPFVATIGRFGLQVVLPPQES